MSAHRSFRTTAISLAALASLALALTALVGCGAGIEAGPAPAVASSIAGTVYGGSTPIGNASLTLWETDTTNAGYPSATNEVVTKVQTATSDPVTGSFAFAAHTCGTQTATTTGGSVTGAATAGPFLYITSIGGNTGSGPNANAYLIAALGPCSYLENNRANLKVTVNEATTVAAALALGNFMYVDTSKSTVYIDAPANNNALTGSCSTGTSMTCSAAGLSHAFANAYNLVDAMNFSGVAPSGGGRTSIVANPMTGSAANPNAVVPQAQIHALANIVSTCINSAGGSGTAGNPNATPATTTGTDGSNCGNFFALATTASGTVPTDTITATINVVQNPSHNVGSSTANGLFQLGGGTGTAFQPTLSTYPHDWSFGIFYPGTVASFSQPQAVALDANDNAYASAILAVSSNPVNGSVTAFSSSGSQLWTSGNNGTICAPGNIATDTVGNVWVANYTSSSFCSTGTSGLYSFPLASSGSSVAIGNSFTSASAQNVQGATWALAVDRSNNLWYGRKNSTCNTTAGTGANTSPVCVGEIPYISSSSSYGADTNIQKFVSGPDIQGTPLVNIIDIVPDANQNIWVGSYESGSDTAIGVIPNTGTALVPGYNLGSTPAALTAQPFGMLAIDKNGNAWTGTASSIFYYSLSSTTVSAATPAVLGNGTITATKPQGAQFDGNGKLFFPSETSAGQIWFLNTTAAAASDVATVTAGNLVPCYLPSSSSTTCTVGSGYARTLQIDSTGAVWVAASNLSIGTSSATGVGALVQMLGVGAPAWPQLSYAKFGVEPQ